MIIGRHLILVINKSRTYRTKKVESRKMKKKVEMTTDLALKYLLGLV